MGLIWCGFQRNTFSVAGLLPSRLMLTKHSSSNHREWHFETTIEVSSHAKEQFGTSNYAVTGSYFGRATLSVYSSCWKIGQCTSMERINYELQSSNATLARQKFIVLLRELEVVIVKHSNCKFVSFSCIVYLKAAPTNHTVPGVNKMPGVNKIKDAAHSGQLMDLKCYRVVMFGH